MPNAIDQIKTYFNTTDKPTEAQFFELIDFISKGVATELVFPNCTMIVLGANPEDVTFSIAAGVATITLPDGMHLKSATIQGVGADAVYAAGNFTNAFKVKVITSSSAINLDLATMLAFRPAIINLNNVGTAVSTNSTAVYDTGAIEFHTDELGNSAISVVADKLGQFYSKWAFVI